MKGAIGVFLGFLILNSGFANTEAPVISRDSKTPKAVLANTPYTIRFEVLNRGSQPLTIVPPSASLMGNHAECGISKFTPSPIQTGRKGSIEVQCSWSSAGMNSAFRRKELTIATAP